jgi:hypothetical protein
MIAFATLFLGLFLGERPVEVVVGEGVAAVELRLDGESLGTMNGPPWTMPCDFGSELAPRHLEAVALDAGGRELGRVSQWLNLPQPAVVISAVLEPRQAGQPRGVRLSWESSAGAEPEAVDVTLDGDPVAVADPRRFELPPVDESEFHLLHVEMRFADWQKSRIDLTFGGAYADQVSTENTAIALLATGGAVRAPTLAEVQGWLTRHGEPLRVLTVEREVAEVVVVLGRPFPRFVMPGERYKPPKGLRLESDHRMRFVSTVAEQSQGVAATFDLFPTSPAYDREVGDVYQLLTGMMRPQTDRQPRLAAAVAVAGLAAYEGRRRRAVVLVPSPQPGPEGDLDPAQVRRYLERLRVPFFVWDPELKTGPHVAEWGTVRNVASLRELAAAYGELAAELDRQWIVWLDGRHLPQDVRLSPDARGFVLAGTR